MLAKFRIEVKIGTNCVVTDNVLTTTSESETSQTLINVWKIQNNLKEAGAVKINGSVKQIMVKFNLMILDIKQGETQILMVYLVENNNLIHKYNFTIKSYSREETKEAALIWKDILIIESGGALIYNIDKEKMDFKETFSCVEIAWYSK